MRAMLAGHSGTTIRARFPVAMPLEAVVFRDATLEPLSALFRFKTEDEAIKLANDGEFGPAVDLHAREVADLPGGGGDRKRMVGVNEGVVSTEVAPFGRAKASGLGA